jgi:hypothetical protein
MDPRFRTLCTCIFVCVRACIPSPGAHTRSSFNPLPPPSPLPLKFISFADKTVADAAAADVTGTLSLSSFNPPSAPTRTWRCCTRSCLVEVVEVVLMEMEIGVGMVAVWQQEK